MPLLAFHPAFPLFPLSALLISVLRNWYLVRYTLENPVLCLACYAEAETSLLGPTLCEAAVMSSSMLNFKTPMENSTSVWTHFVDFYACNAKVVLSKFLSSFHTPDVFSCLVDFAS